MERFGSHGEMLRVGSFGGATVPQVSSSDAPPFDGRFLVWRGASGRSYVFSPVEDDDMPLDAAVLIAVRRDRDGAPCAARPVTDRDAGRGEVWAHHLATTGAARAAAIADLVASGRVPEAFGRPDAVSGGRFGRA